MAMELIIETEPVEIYSPEDFKDEATAEGPQTIGFAGELFHNGEPSEGAGGLQEARPRLHLINLVGYGGFE